MACNILIKQIAWLCLVLATSSDAKTFFFGGEHTILAGKAVQWPIKDTAETKQPYGHVTLQRYSEGSINVRISKATSMSWIGWKSDFFANKKVRVNFDIKFWGKPAPSNCINCGMKMYGKHIKSWLDTCQPNQWCHVEFTHTMANSGDDYLIILIMDQLVTQYDLKNFYIETLDESDAQLFEKTGPALAVGDLCQGVSNKFERVDSETLKVAVDISSCGSLFLNVNMHNPDGWFNEFFINGQLSCSKDCGHATGFNAIEWNLPSQFSVYIKQEGISVGLAHDNAFRYHWKIQRTIYLR